MITVTDAAGNKINMATVAVYGSETDFLNETSAARNGSTDVNGQVTFTLSSAKYWYRAKSGCMTNDNSIYATNGVLLQNNTTNVGVVIKSTGNFVLNNTSTYSYKIFFGGVEAGILPGGMYSQLKYLLTGTYTIRVVQQGAPFPTDQTYQRSITCCQTTTLTFP